MTTLTMQIQSTIRAPVVATPTASPVATRSPHGRTRPNVSRAAPIDSTLSATTYQVPAPGSSWNSRHSSVVPSSAPKPIAVRHTADGSTDATATYAATTAQRGVPSTT
ncbi:hypothetical protein [Nocardioides speluncae]|uniref:hypothetical protein n=1 Tax=Nocardioides speluncae TaxID=2670337 RepID=UPI00198021E9|nr:hypothetical protein [Nocardioides speluncae]